VLDTRKWVACALLIQGIVGYGRMGSRFVCGDNLNNIQGRL
jgi:hypothetical protein